jgi:hypothetical protein
MRFVVASFASLFVVTGCADLFSGSFGRTQGLDEGENAEIYGDERDPALDGCTLTQGYWKNHEEAWPVDSLDIGGVTYTKEELLALYNTPPSGDASLILEHQLATAKLNVAAGASAPGNSIAEGDAWMADNADDDGRLPYGSGDNEDAVRIAGDLDAYNNGVTGPGHCDDGPPSGDDDDDSDSDSDSDNDGDSDGDSDTDSDGECPPETEGCGGTPPAEGEGEGEGGEVVNPGEGEGEEGSEGEGEEGGDEGCVLPGTNIPCSG